MANYTRLGINNATFDKMIQRFGVVTVMNAKVFDVAEILDNFGENFFENNNAYQIFAALKDLSKRSGSSFGYTCKLDTLKVANVTEEGPTKTVTGGQYSNPLIKFGKSARLEMQDALGNAEAVEALCGGVVEYDEALDGTRIGLHMGEDFQGPKLILGDSFFIEQTSGQQVKVAIIFYQFLPDSLFNLTQDAEGDATVFDMNGDLLTTTIKVGTLSGTELPHGVFYSVIDPNHSETTAEKFTISVEEGTMTVTAATGYTVSSNGGAFSTTATISAGQAARIQVKETATGAIVVDTVLAN